MLYAAGVPNREMMKNAPHVGIATVWYVRDSPFEADVLGLGHNLLRRPLIPIS